MSTYKKIITAILSSWLCMAGGILLIASIIGSIGMFWGGSSDDTFYSLIAVFLLPVLFCIVGCYIMASTNTQSFKRALLASVIAVFVGIPFAYFILAVAFGDFIKAIMSPGFSALRWSYAYDYIWLHIMVICTVEAITDMRGQPRRWLRLIVGTLAIILLVTCFEIATSNVFTRDERGVKDTNTIKRLQTSREIEGMIKFGLYGTLVWAGIVGTINLPEPAKKLTEKHR